jgi:cytochrome P450
MGIFGPNLITQNGDDWQRSRKIVAPLLNERISDLVWKESSKQANDMVDHFLATAQGKTDETLGGLRSIAIHVLGSAGYGVSQPWKEEVQELEPGHKVSYIDALHAVVNDFILLVVLPAKVLALPFMPKAAQKLGISAQEFPVYTREMLERERTLAASSTQPRNNLMSTLVKASDEEKKQDTKNKMSQSLSEHELAGNLYLFTIAGFDTTANTLAYAVTTLAVYPEWQDWIIEEIDSVLKHGGGTDYETIFPKLGRCLALMVSSPGVQ